MSEVFVSARQRFQKISNSKKQLWVVGYVNATLKESIQDLENSFNNGADAVVLESKNYSQLDETLKELRRLFPQQILGVNFLGPDEDLHTFAQTFMLAEKHHLQIAWTDFAGVDLIHEAPEISLHTIETAKGADVFYVSGIHMKYSTLLNSQKLIEQSALQAMGWVDGIVITGSQTGDPTDPQKARRVREVIGNYPLGIASGASAENIGSLIEFIDFALVNSSIADPQRRILPAKVKELRQAMGHARI